MKKLIKKIKNYLFEKKCPCVKCVICKYCYIDKNHNRRCKLVDKYKI